jgi:hypothetical protein
MEKGYAALGRLCKDEGNGAATEKAQIKRTERDLGQRRDPHNQKQSCSAKDKHPANTRKQYANKEGKWE